MRVYMNVLYLRLARMVRPALYVCAMVAACGLALTACEEIIPPVNYTCDNGTEANGTPGDAGDTARCARCDDGYVFVVENNSCRQAAYTCTGGDAVGGNPDRGNSDIERCASCGSGSVLDVDEAVCIQVVYLCPQGIPDPGNPDGDSNVEKCGSCNDGYVLENDACRRAIYTCETGGDDGVAASGNPDGVTSDVERCVSCSAGLLLTADNACSNDIDGDGTPNDDDIDNDNNGLIEIHDLNMLNNIRWNLAGTTYDDEEADTDPDDAGITTGAPREGTAECPLDEDNDGFYLCGYELVRDLDFAVPADYASGLIDSTWRPNPADPDSVTNKGWPGIGTSSTNGLNALFEGNGYTITNLYSRRNALTGLFSSATTNARIRNIGLVDVAIYSSSTIDNTGALVGQNAGTIVGAYATGNVNDSTTGTTTDDDVGGLVGENSGTIIASYADVRIDSTGVTNGGGLVGFNNGGTIIASHATGSINNSTGANNFGGLVGIDDGGTIIGSYSASSIRGGDVSDAIGGLVGTVFTTSTITSTITASYATGFLDGGDDGDRLGGLIVVVTDSTETETEPATIVASYSITNIDGGAHDSEAGTDEAGYIAPGGGALTLTDTHGIGNISAASLGNNANDRGADLLGTSATILHNRDSSMPGYVGDTWDDAGNNTLNAWDFGNNENIPALRYADYDGTGDVYTCDMFPATIPGSDTPIVCNQTLLPRQRD